MFNNSSDPGNVLQKTIRFSEHISLISRLLALQILVRREHEVFLPKELPKLHLLYYPSLSHLTKWEPCSFLAYVFDRGNFVCGDKQCLKNSNATFRSQENAIPQTTYPYSIDSYVNSAIMHFLYLHLNPSALPLSFHSSGLIYSLRFAITIMFADQLQPGDSIRFWDWDELLSYIHRKYPNQASLISLFSNKNSLVSELSLPQLKLLSKESLHLFDTGITLLTDHEFGASLFTNGEVNNNAKTE
ncbi:MAG: hypothetical protein K8S62_11880 [Candidatus Sabulitectum sp.]|nr:hypothetical protein [Candidatus Sabulitectum sp.]